MTNLSIVRADPKVSFRRLLLCACASAAAAARAAGPSEGFMKYWKSGLAEISSYDVVTERYGENRRAQAVLVFVYEEIDADTRVKVESGKTPPSRRVPVLKLNHVLKFNTGIYDYSVMTSVFSGLSGPGVERFLEPRKVSFSSQEWCGHVYHQVVPRREGLVSEIHSYFETEGDARTVLPYPRKGSGPPEPVYYEDEMPMLVRELDGEWLKPGESREIALLPSLWSTRKRHRPLALTRAVLTKTWSESAPPAGGGKPGSRPLPAGTTWTLESEGKATTYVVEADPPHKLLAWEDSRGEGGRLLRSRRKTYWELNRNRDEPLRKELGLIYGVGE